MAFWKKKKPKVYPKKLVVGLGNPGGQYKHTRHNVGFDVVDELAKTHGISVSKSKHQALVGEGEMNGVPVALVKPTTFMNLSGRAVKPLLVMYGLGPEDLLVVADDLDMEVGKVRMRMKGSSGGHNGHKSVSASLGTKEYPRLKIGIGKKEVTVKHVLSKFHPDERGVIQEAIGKSSGAVEIWVTGDVDKAMIYANSNE